MPRIVKQRQGFIQNTGTERLSSFMARYFFYDRSAEPELDALADLARRMCGVSLAAITIVDYDRLVLKGRVGLEAEAARLRGSFCERTMAETMLIVPDTHADQDFKNHPLVVAAPFARFYAGVKLVTDEGDCVGTLCVLDDKPNDLSADQRSFLGALATQVMTALELRRLNAEFQSKNLQLSALLADQKAKHQLLLEASSTTLLSQNIFNNLAVGIIKADAQTGRIRFVNRSVVELLQYSEADLLAKTVHDLTHEDDRAENARRLNSVFAERRAQFSHEKRYVKKDGEAVWVRVLARLIKEESDFYVGVIYDITNERQALSRALEVDARYQQLADALPILLWAVRPDLGVEYTNQRLNLTTRANGVAGQTTTDELFEGIVHPEDLNLIRAAWSTARRHPREFELELRIRDERGSFVWYLLRSTPILDERAEVEKWYFTAANIETTKRTFEIVNRREQELDLATSSAGVGLWEWDIVTNEIRLNPIERTLLGLGPNVEVIKFAQFEKLIHPEDSASLGRALTYAIEHRVEYNAEFRIVRNGEIRWLTGRGRVFYSPEGRPLRMVGANTDATLFRQDLIEKQQLRIREQSAQSASRLKSEFLANMSHEIRTPVNGIIGMTNLLLEEGLAGESRHFAESIQKSSSLLLVLINDILDISKIEAGKMELEILPFDFEEMIADVTQCFSVLARAKNLYFRVESTVAPGTGMVGDISRIRQILNNLIGNSLKFTAVGGITLSVRTEGSGPGARLYFTLKDSGVGIPAAAIDRLFQNFNQGDSSTARRFGGTGLGLAICKRFVELMGGSIRVTSEVEVGTEFNFDLAIELSPVRIADRPTKPEVTPSRLGEGERGKFKVLIAEDNQINQEISARMLRKAGYRAEVVANGLEVLTAVESFRYDLILMDCQMPEMDGYAATKRLRELGMKLPIIALTANAFAEDRARCAAAGMSDYVSKPVSSAALIGVVDQYLGGGRVHRVDSAVAIDSIPSIDPRAIDQLRFLDEDGADGLIAKLIQLYTSTTPAKIHEMTDHVDDECLPKLAHALKSSSANLGLTRVVKILDEIEAGGLTRERVTGLLERLEAEYRRAEQDFGRVVGNLPSA